LLHEILKIEECLLLAQLIRTANNLITRNLENISQEEGLFSLDNYLRSCDSSLAKWQAQHDAHGLGE
jgi:hypothetical protein